MRTGWIAVGLAMVVASDVAAAQRRPTERRDAQLIYTIGAPVDGRPSADAIAAIADVRVTPVGYLVVLDSAGRRVYVRAPDGSRVSEFGRWGRAPGELAAPTLVGVTDSTITIRDGVHRRTDTFSLHGDLLSSTAESSPPDADRLLEMRGGTQIVVRSPVVSPALREPPPAGSLHVQIGVQPRGAASADWLFRVRRPTVYLRMAGNLPPLRQTVSPPARGGAVLSTPLIAMTSRFGGGGAWARSGDSLLIHADGYSGELTWYVIDARGARIAETAQLGRTGRDITTDDIASEAERLSAIMSVGRGRDPSASAAARYPAELFGVPSQWSMATTLLIADDGAVWVGINRMYYVPVNMEQGVRVGDENTWAVFPPKGNAFTVTLRPLFRLTAVSGGRLYGFVDEGAGPMVAVYELR